MSTSKKNPERRPAPFLAATATLAWLLSMASAPDARPQSPSGAPPTARAVMERTLARVSDILLSEEIEREAKRDGIQELIDDTVDFEIVSRLVLARNWTSFSEEQRTEFIALFRKHLLYTYWNNADYSNFQAIEVTGDRKEQRRDWTVLSRVKAKGSEDILIDYRLRQLGEEGDENGEWKIIDIVIEGVSLVSNFRSQFQSIVSNGGPPRLIELLREKVAEAEKAEEEETAKAEDS